MYRMIITIVVAVAAALAVAVGAANARTTEGAAPTPVPVETTLPWDSTGNISGPLTETIRLARAVCTGTDYGGSDYMDARPGYADRVMDTAIRFCGPVDHAKEL